MSKNIILLFLIFASSILAAAQLKSGYDKCTDLWSCLNSPSKIVFHFSDGNVPATIVPDGTKFVFQPLGILNNNISINTDKHIDRGSPSQNRNHSLEFNESHAIALNVELQVDTFEEKTDVRKLTQKLEQLALSKHELHEGNTSCLVTIDLNYNCYVARVVPHYTMFLEDGTPVRATVNLTLVEPTRQGDRNVTRHSSPLLRFFYPVNLSLIQK
ncbi:hypothetical protein HY988_01390 [Candidatus Micrarchaeota archaeon]|nr:hypothetical protein [Candidatus Micrarchaeota archaeon]